MPRGVFFSFHYDRDINRVQTIKNNYVTKGNYTAAGFFDRSVREAVKKTNPENIKRSINKYLEGTTVTAVLIGRETASRNWVEYEIRQSWERKNGMLGIYINNIRDMITRTTDLQGSNPFDNLTTNDDGKPISRFFRTYDWVYEDGYNNFGRWVEQAAEDAKRIY